MSYKKIDFSFKTAPVTAIPVNPYFRSKSAVHDVTLTSFVCKNVGREGTACLVVIPALI